jgi:glutathione peroxidase-family protein
MRYSIFVCLCLFSSGILNAQSSVYQQQIQDKNGKNISISSIAGKKILIALCSVYSPDVVRLKVLDKLNKSNAANLQVIVVPLVDIDSPSSGLTVRSPILDTMATSFIVCKAGGGKKNNGANQIPILKWLTNKSGNVHLDVDLQNSNQMFVVGENGILYAELFGTDDISNGNLAGVLKSSPPAN